MTEEETNVGNAKQELSAVGFSGAYMKSFGPMPDRTVYSNPLRSKDVRPRVGKAVQKAMKEEKAMTTGNTGSGTASPSAYVPVYVDMAIIDQSRQYTPLVEVLPRVTNNGLTADYTVITSKGNAYVAGEDSALSSNDNSVSRKSQNIKYLYSVGRVTGQMQAATPGYVMRGLSPTGAGLTGNNPFTDENAENAKQIEVLTKARALKELEEDLVLNGDSSSNTHEFDGIIKQQGTTNQIDLAGASLSYDDMEDAVKEAYKNGGRPNLAVCSPTVYKQIRSIALDSLRLNQSDINIGSTFGLPVGMKLNIYTASDMVLIPSTFLNDTASSRQIYFLDTNHIEMRVLQDMVYEDLAKTNDSQKFMLKIYECLIMRAPQFNAFIKNIA